MQIIGFDANFFSLVVVCFKEYVHQPRQPQQRCCLVQSQKKEEEKINGENNFFPFVADDEFNIVSMSTCWAKSDGN